MPAGYWVRPSGKICERPGKIGIQTHFGRELLRPIRGHTHQFPQPTATALFCAWHHPPRLGWTRVCRLISCKNNVFGFTCLYLPLPAAALSIFPTVHSRENRRAGAVPAPHQLARSSPDTFNVCGFKHCGFVLCAPDFLRRLDFIIRFWLSPADHINRTTEKACVSGLRDFNGRTMSIQPGPVFQWLPGRQSGCSKNELLTAKHTRRKKACMDFGC